MEWIERLSGHTVAIDTAPIIYFIEGRPEFLETLRVFFAALHVGKFLAVTSTVTLTEVLVHPIRAGQQRLCDRYRKILLNEEHLHLIPVTHRIAEKAAEIRAKYNLRTPDSIQIAVAHTTHADFLLTNDMQLSRLSSPKVLVLNALVGQV
ncbi:MAG: type II toxin-antitoxin system VapC family toxin [Burkholderiales bacterium]|jgi:predicted nucleic acid-binding protein|nr:type II toxin-antitoxin system VapC family toxin [Burkholderiales bacterium]